MRLPIFIDVSEKTSSFVYFHHLIIRRSRYSFSPRLNKLISWIIQIIQPKRWTVFPTIQIPFYGISQHPNKQKSYNVTQWKLCASQVSNMRSHFSSNIVSSMIGITVLNVLIPFLSATLSISNHYHKDFTKLSYISSD